MIHFLVWPFGLSLRHGIQYAVIILASIMELNISTLCCGPNFCLLTRKHGSILERMSCWVLTIRLLANKLSKVQPIQQATLQELLVYQSMGFATWRAQLMLLILCQHRLSGSCAVCSLWFEFRPTWRNTYTSCQISAI